MARDPIALELIEMGEEDAALAWLAHPHRPYSDRLARWAVRALLSRAEFEHGVRTILRHARLVAEEPRRARAHARGALARQVGIALRGLRGAARSPSVRRELERALAEVARVSGDRLPFEDAFHDAVRATLGRLVRDRHHSFSEAGFRS